jgi:hypothetical protein
MNEHATPSILQRVPVILAVTAASYGLPLQAQGRSLKVRTAQSASITAPGSSLEQCARETAPQH